MRLNLFHRLGGHLSPGEKARREHERWLTRAMRAENTGALRVPIREVSRGGFSGLMGARRGRAWAERWWMDAINRADIGV